MKTPHGWRSTPLMDLVQQPVSGVSVLSSDEPPTASNPGVLRLSCVTKGRFNPRDLKTPIPSEVHRLSAFAEADTIIISRSNTPQLVGASAYVKSTHPNAFLPDTLWSLRPRDKKLSIRWLSFVLNSDAYSLTIQSIAHGTSDSMKKIQKGSFLKLPVLLPPLPEQQKIADILGTWDEALEKLDALIAAKARRKQALMQQLLTGHRRLPGFSKPWETANFSRFLTESRIEGTDGLIARKITVKLYGRGVLAKQDRMAGSANTKYFVRRSGQLIYSKLDFLNGAFGIIPPELNGYESTLDLPSFDVKPNADVRWLLSYLVRPEFYEKQVGAAAGGRIARRVNPPEFLKLRIKAPELAEQLAITDILDTAEAELRLLRQQRTALDQQKRGLMQQLLTGKMRVST